MTVYHHRIIASAVYLPVMRKAYICYTFQSVKNIFIFIYDRLIGYVRAGHYQNIKIFYEQIMKWRIRQHYPNSGIIRSKIFCQKICGSTFFKSGLNFSVIFKMFEAILPIKHLPPNNLHHHTDPSVL